MSSPTEIKVVVCGAPNTGKTSFVRRFVDGNFDDDYIPTLGVEVHPLHFNTNKGGVQFNVWDCAGQPHLRGLADGYYVGADCAIVFVGDGGDEAYKTYIHDLRLIKHDIPIVLVGNKIDVVGNGVGGWGAIIYDELAGGYHRVDMSAKSNVNIEKPFVHLARVVMGEDDLEIVEGSFAPPAVPSTTVNYEETLEKAYKI